MNLLTKEAILAAVDLSSESVNVPEWGGDVRVRAMSALERAALDEEVFGPKGDKTFSMRDYKLKLVALSLVDAEGVRLFGNDEVPLLGEKHSAVIERLASVALRVNGLGAAGAEAAAKNSGTAPGSGSSTDLP